MTSSNNEHIVIQIHEDLFMDFPPEEQAPPIPRKITIPLAPIAGGSNIGETIRDIFTKAEVSISKEFKELEDIPLAPIRIEWQKGVGQALPTVTIHAEPIPELEEPIYDLPDAPDLPDVEFSTTYWNNFCIICGTFLAAVTCVLMYGQMLV